MRSELENSRAVIEAALGVRPQHLAYPVGDRTSAGPREFKIAAELGFKTAVTTRPGVIFPGHAEPSDRAAAHLAQRRVPAAALRPRADLGRGDRAVERLPPGQRDLSGLPYIHLISGMAGSTQPMPATT